MHLGEQLAKFLAQCPGLQYELKRAAEFIGECWGIQYLSAKHSLVHNTFP